MSLLFLDGFDHYGTDDVLSKWDGKTLIGAGIVIDPAYSRNASGQGLKLYTYYTIARGLVYKNIPERDTVIVGFACKNTGSNWEGDSSYDFGISFKGSAGVQCTITASPTGFLQLRRGGIDSTIIATSTIALSQGVWAYVEIKLTVDNVTGAYEFKVDGVSAGSGTGLDTQAQSTGGITQVGLGALSYRDYWYYDDLYICDTLGTKNNDFLGDLSIYTLYPTSDGTHTDFTPSTGTDHYATVDEELVDDSDYNDTDVAGNKDTFNMEAAPSGTILGVQSIAICANTGGGGGVTAKSICRSGATPADNEGDETIVPASAKAVTCVWDQEPTDAVDWTTSKIDAAEFGIKMES